MQKSRVPLAHDSNYIKIMHKKLALLSPKKTKISLTNSYTSTPVKSKKILIDDKSNSKNKSVQYTSKIIKSILDRSKEYEKEIQRFLGVDNITEDSPLKHRNKFILHRINPIKKPKISYKLPHSLTPEATPDVTWNNELKKIETKEKQIKKYLLDLDIKQKKFKKNSQSFKTVVKRDEKKENIYKSLAKVSQMLSKFLNSPTNGIKKKKGT
ncbi:hypothetical protein SteCoe_30614 [Stentor coeruleus]|uniref:Uncharacterized protein n=1 Tax=Stentor coeruleus TaxID=5963 RepID=A0A1R2B367_9CILI|nr:hypothetical protein SteCoe_30614 [Stentor coeruleus]